MINFNLKFLVILYNKIIKKIFKIILIKLNKYKKLIFYINFFLFSYLIINYFFILFIYFHMKYNFCINKYFLFKFLLFLNIFIKLKIFSLYNLNLIYNEYIRYLNNKKIIYNDNIISLALFSGKEEYETLFNFYNIFELRKKNFVYIDLSNNYFIYYLSNIFPNIFINLLWKNFNEVAYNIGEPFYNWGNIENEFFYMLNIINHVIYPRLLIKIISPAFYTFIFAHRLDPNFFNAGFEIIKVLSNSFKFVYIIDIFYNITEIIKSFL